MAFKDDKVRTTTLPGGNQGPGLIILHDPGTTHANINTAYLARGTALATTNDRIKDEAVLKRYEAMAGQIKAGRGRANRGATDVGAVLVRVGSDGVSLARAHVTTDATTGVDTVTVS